MKTTDQSPSGLIRTLSERLLRCVLLVGIVYSATLGSIHSHWDPSSRSGTDVFADLLGQANVSAELPPHGRPDGGQCLICLLHRQFSSSIVQTPFFIAGLTTPTAFVPTLAAYFYSNTVLSFPVTRHSGRAPPVLQA